MKTHTVNGAGGIRLHVREWGDPDGIPLLLIHGWSQSHRCWAKQISSFLQDEFRIVAPDLRGHGMSDAPLDATQYTDGDRWADDVEAIMVELGLEGAVLVAWSYGGYVVGDFVRRHGQKRISGIDFVAAAVVLGTQAFGSLIGPGFLDHAPDASSTDLPTAVAAMRRFLRACIVRPVPQEDFEEQLACSMVVRPEVRGFLIQRELDFAGTLTSLEMPVLVTHGRADTVVLPAMSDYILQCCPTARASWYHGVGHASFLESPERFNAELGDFARRAHG